MKTTIEHGDTTTLPVFRWEDWPGALEGPQGTGKLYLGRMGENGPVVWIHESPRGWQHPISHDAGPMPKLTHTPRPEPVGRCGCGKYHHCSQCGEQTWIEFHGVADGQCTYCRHSG